MFSAWNTISGLNNFVIAILQGALADIFLRGSNLITDAQGMASLVCLPFLSVIPSYKGDLQVSKAKDFIPVTNL